MLLKNFLQEMVRDFNWENKLYETKIRRVWGEKMGYTIFEQTKAITLRKKKLHLTIISASLRQELSYQRDKIREMLNRELGAEVIQEVIIHA